MPLAWKVCRGHQTIVSSDRPFLCCPPPFAKAGDIKTHSSVCLSVRLSVCPSVTKTLTWLISSEVLMIEQWYLVCMILGSSPFNWHHAVTLTLTFDLLQGQSCCRAGDHNSPNLLVRNFVPLTYKMQYLKFGWSYSNQTLTASSS